MSSRQPKWREGYESCDVCGELADGRVERFRVCARCDGLIDRTLPVKPQIVAIQAVVMDACIAALEQMMAG